MLFSSSWFQPKIASTVTSMRPNAVRTPMTAMRVEFPDPTLSSVALNIESILLQKRDETGMWRALAAA